MRLARIFVIVIVAAALVIGFVVDDRDRPIADVTVLSASSVPVVARDGGVWFCPGGSAAGGVAEVSLELINIGGDAATAVVAGVRSGTGEDARESTVVVEPGAREIVRLTELVPDSAWMGAVVEVTAGQLVVEQTFIGAALGTDRAPCDSRTSTTWISAAGATRATEEFGESLTLLVLNPFLDDAVLNISFDSDVGVDSKPGIVVPARRVVAVDLTTEVTVASRVSAIIDVVSGRVAVSRLQVIDNPEQTGVAVTPASVGAAPVWFIPSVDRDLRNDVITVVNPSSTETAEVDLEIVADGDQQFDPILLTVRPGRSVAVSIAAETRLEGVGAMSVVARSLTGLPIAVMNESALSFGEGRVSNLSATSGLDAAATEWVAPVEAEAGGIVIYNPSSSSIATVHVSAMADGERVTLAPIELGPMARAFVAAGELGGQRPIVTIESASPIVVGRTLSGVSLHAQLAAIAVGETEPLR
jgi:hypothetical protein